MLAYNIFYLIFNLSKRKLHYKGETALYELSVHNIGQALNHPLDL